MASRILIALSILAAFEGGEGGRGLPPFGAAGGAPRVPWRGRGRGAARIHGMNVVDGLRGGGIQLGDEVWEAEVRAKVAGMKIDQLKASLKERKLQVSGSKSDLVGRSELPALRELMD